MVGDIVSLRLLTEQIFFHAKSFDDKLNSIYHTVSALCYTSQLPEAVKRITLTLSELGESMPETHSESDVKLFVEQTDSILKEFSTDEDLIEHKLMEDPQTQMTMKFYARLETAFLMVKPEAQPIVTMKMVQLSIIHGMSPISPLCFTYFGQLLARLGDIREGCRYVRLGRKMLSKLGSEEVSGEVIAIGNEVLAFLEPLQSTLGRYIEGYNIAMAAGDVHSALLNRIIYVANSFHSGQSLPDWQKRYAECHRLLVEHNHYTFLSQIKDFRVNFERLTSIEDSFEFDHQKMQAVKNSNPHAMFQFHFQQQYIHFMFREFNEMKANADKYFYFNLINWSLMYYRVNHAFYGSLVAFWIYRETGESIWADMARKRLIIMKKWAEHNEWNFQHKAYLMEAEEAFCNNDTDAAEILYGKAISLARKHR